MSTPGDHEIQSADGPPPPDPSPQPVSRKKYFGREDIMKAQDQQFAEVAVPEWAPPGDPHPEDWVLNLKGMTGRERDRFEASMAPKGNSKKPQMDNFRAKLIVQCAVDGDGNRMFNAGDVSWIGEKSARALARAFDACQEMNGLTDSDVDDLTEDFDGGPNGASTSG
jgi:hypothetical protein